MQIKTDFVTSLCGGSFIFPRRLELTKGQKEALLGFVGKKLSEGGKMREGKSPDRFMAEYDFTEGNEAFAVGKFDEREGGCREAFEEEAFAAVELYCEVWNAVENSGDGRPGCG